MIKFKTREEYYDFFAAIPEEKWCVKDFVSGDKCCALGHLGIRHGMFVVHPFHDLVNQLEWGVVGINDGRGPMEDLGDHPKERVLNAIVLLESGILGDV